MKRENRNSKGFTLIEMLVVVLIIGILAAIALPQYKVSVAKTKYALLKQYNEKIVDAALQYFLIYDTWPTKVDNLDIDFGVKIDENVIKVSNDIRCTFSSEESGWGYFHCIYIKDDGTYVLDYVVSMIPKHPSAGFHLKRYRRCDVWGPRDLNSPYHKMCQQESGKAEPNQCSTTAVGENVCKYNY